jgi:asparagine synthase (glutamine-hydrolysing)
MCGIAGWSGDPGADPQALERMTEAVRHRGPDSDGAHVEPGRCAIGFRRLSIIDLAGGDQPLYSEDRRVVATCNGEIYNFAALREELRALGHSFRTASDCEVIPHAYEEWGLGFVERLRGMFAIALWDAERARLVLVRDRLGKKPLYYAELPGGLLYGSEPAAVLASGLVTPRPDPVAIGHYLALQYVPPPRSGFEGIAKLAPGELLVHEAGRVEVQRYWTLRHEPEPVAADEALDRLDALVREATQLRLVADVPLGAFLSGGIDSSLVVSYMAEAGGRTRTFSMDFAHEQFSEGAHARRVADLYGTEHEEMLVEPDMVATTLETIRFAGEPFADPSALPTYLLSAMTRRHVTVALSGDGGDEAFAGYRRHKVAAYAHRLGPLSTLARPLKRLDRRLAMLAVPAERRYAEMMSHFGPDQMAEVCDPGFLREAAAGPSPWDDVLALPDARGVDRFGALDTTTYLPGAVLTKVDRMSMAHALEVRSPLLDQEVYEYAARLPPGLKLRRGTTKWLLRQLALRRGMPEDLVLRPKQGFGVPVGQWFRDEQRAWITGLLLDDQSLGRGYFRPEAVRRLLDDHVAGRADHAPRLWSLAMLELWHRQYIDAPVTAPA